MAKQTRRSFLEISALGLVAATVPDALGQKTDQSKPAAGNSPISIWVTSDNQRYHAGPTIRWNESSGRATADGGQIQLNPDKQFQDILGFGGAFTDAACYTFNRLEPVEREALFPELFHPSQMGLSTGRLCVGSSDYATKVYSFDEGDPDPEMKRFSIAHDREYILPILREATAPVMETKSSPSALHLTERFANPASHAIVNDLPGQGWPCGRQASYPGRDCDRARVRRGTAMAAAAPGASPFLSE